MKKVIKVLILVIVIGLFSCKKNDTKQNKIVRTSEFTKIQINPKKIEKDNNFISLFSDSITYIPLETKDDFLIGDIDKIIVKENKIFILDKVSEVIFCFDLQNGNFLYKIDSRGSGPGEYISIENFIVDSNDNVLIYSSSQGIFKYNNGKFIDKIESRIIASDFYLNKDSSINFYTGRLPNESIFNDFPNQYRLVKVNNNKIEENYLPYIYNDNYLKIPSGMNSFYSLDDTLHLIEYLNQEIYSFHDDILKPKYKFFFTTNNETFNFSQKAESNLLIMEKIKNNDYTMLNSIIESNGYLFLSYNLKNIEMYSYIQKNKNKINNIGMFYFDDFNNIPLGAEFLYSTGDELIGYVEPNIFLDLLNNKDVSSNLKLLKDKTETFNNPIIVKLKLK